MYHYQTIWTKQQMCFFYARPKLLKSHDGRESTLRPSQDSLPFDGANGVLWSDGNYDQPTAK